jgi:triosephosphate isomerase (TIM)
VKPIIIINFKAYPQTIGENAIRLAKICERVAYETGSDIRIAVSAPDIYPVCRVVSIPVYAEHVDSYPLGKHTGSILPEMVKTAGATGTLLNHSEHQIPIQKLEDSIKRSAHLSLTTIVCAVDPKMEKKIIACKYKPDMVAVEPPELIGGDISVSSAKPGLIARSVETVKKKHRIKLLVGAGIKTREDVIKAIELGADGVLIASGIDLARDPEKALLALLP